jgi:hypothetical protein
MEQALSNPEVDTILRVHPFEIRGCSFSAVLSSCFADLQPTIGLVDVGTCAQHYDKLLELGFQAADLHCEGYVFTETVIRNFRERFGSGISAQGSLRLPGSEVPSALPECGPCGECPSEADCPAASTLAP